MDEIVKQKHYTHGCVECLDAIESMYEERSRIDFYRTQIIIICGDAMIRTR